MTNEKNQRARRTRRAAVALSFFLGLAASHAMGQTSRLYAEGRVLQEASFQSSQQFHRESEERAIREQMPEIWLIQEDDVADAGTLPAETPCYQISDLRIALPAQLSAAQQRLGASHSAEDPFFFLQQALAAYRGQCIGREGLDLISRRLSALIYSQGYSTTHLEVPEQQWSSGTLVFLLTPGVIRSISFSAPDISRNWKSVFTIRPGDLLNVNQLEQGMEEVRRVYMQDVEMLIVPSDRAGESDIIIDVKQSDLRGLSVRLDEFAKKERDRAWAEVMHAIEHPLGKNDLYVISRAAELERKEKEKAREMEKLAKAETHLFDGELSLAPDQDFFSRKEVDAPLGEGDQALYAGLDLGRFNNPALQYLLGEKLAGAALGLRGSVNGFSYDLFLSWAVYKAQNFRTNAQGIGFNLLYQY